MAVSALHLPRSTFRDGALELAKWVALAAMVVDHVNAVFFARELGLVATAVGRIALPLFAVVFAYNIARPGADLRRSAEKLGVFGAVALPAHAFLFAQAGGWWPLNILFAFALAVWVIRLADQERWAWAGVVFFLGGLLVEGGWPGIGLVVAAYYRFRSPTPVSLFGLVIALVGLCWLNGNAWALLAIPVLHGLNRSGWSVPRNRWAFWVLYPAHLVAIAVVSVLL